MAINAKAPVISAGEVRIHAPASVVWTVMSTIGEWPRWNPEISTAEAQGPTCAGVHLPLASRTGCHHLGAA